MRIGIAVVIVLGLPTVVSKVASARRANEARRESVQLLTAAGDRTALEEAVGRLGVLLPVGDAAADELPESWIAIRYRDAHSWPWYSSAVARCSDGTWFRSSVHFCGKFGAYRWARTERDKYIDDPEWHASQQVYFSDWVGTPLHRIETAASIQEAKSALLELGFREFNGR